MPRETDKDKSEALVARKLQGTRAGEGKKGLLELWLPSFTRVLPTDEPDEVLHPGAGHGHHSHWQQSVLA